MNTYINETSLVESKNIGNGSKIWHWTHISKNAVIGKNCNIGQNVYIANDVIIGDNCKIQNNVSIFDNTIFEDNVFCGPSVVFTNVTNPRSEFSRKNSYKQTIIKNGASLGANSTILCGNTIGDYAFIGAGLTVTRSVKSFALSIGIPSKQIAWFSRYGEKIPLDLNGNEFFQCKTTGDKYILKNNELILEK